MTEGMLQQLRRKLIASRGRLMQEHSFFALMLMHVKFVAIPDMKQMSNNGICIFFSPDYLLSLGASELDYLLCHQMLHILCGDIWRPLSSAGDEYHYRCDEDVEEELRLYGFNKKVCGHYRCIAPLRWGDKDRRMIDTDRYWGDVDNVGQSGTVVLDTAEKDAQPTALPVKKLMKQVSDETHRGGQTACDAEAESPFQRELSMPDAEQLKMQWFLRMSVMAEICGQQSADEQGSLALLLQRLLGKAGEPRVDWRKMLRQFIEEKTHDYAFCPPDKRYSDGEFFLPDFNDEAFQPRDILFWVDTSGSMDEDTLAAVYAELTAALTQFQGKLQGKLGFFDALATEPLPFSSVSDLVSIMPVGGGGTDFYAPFDYVKEHCRTELPACMVVLTDGKAEFPPQSYAMGIPVLWVFTEKKAEAPWGSSVCF